MKKRKHRQGDLLYNPRDPLMTALLVGPEGVWITHDTTSLVGTSFYHDDYARSVYKRIGMEEWTE